MIDLGIQPIIAEEIVNGLVVDIGIARGIWVEAGGVTVVMFCKVFSIVAGHLSQGFSAFSVVDVAIIVEGVGCGLGPNHVLFVRDVLSLVSVPRLLCCSAVSDVWVDVAADPFCVSKGVAVANVIGVGGSSLIGELPNCLSFGVLNRGAGGVLTLLAHSHFIST